MSRWGQARIEVLAVYQEIKDELARGVPVKQVYEALVIRGRITVTYNGFRRQVQGIRDDLLRNPVVPPEPPKAAIEGQGEDLVRPKALEEKPKTGFTFNPESKVEDFF